MIKAGSTSQKRKPGQPGKPPCSHATRSTKHVMLTCLPRGSWPVKWQNFSERKYGEGHKPSLCRWNPQSFVFVSHHHHHRHAHHRRLRRCPLHPRSLSRRGCREKSPPRVRFSRQQSGVWWRAPDRRQRSVAVSLFPSPSRWTNVRVA